MPSTTTLSSTPRSSVRSPDWLRAAHRLRRRRHMTRPRTDAIHHHVVVNAPTSDTNVLPLTLIARYLDRYGSPRDTIRITSRVTSDTNVLPLTLIARYLDRYGSPRDTIRITSRVTSDAIRIFFLRKGSRVDSPIRPICTSSTAARRKSDAIRIFFLRKGSRVDSPIRPICTSSTAARRKSARRCCGLRCERCGAGWPGGTEPTRRCRRKR